MKADIRWQHSLNQLGKALGRLGDVLNELLDKADYVLDATIQRFEFSIELYWKALRHLLATQGVIVSLPKVVLQQAYMAGWIHDEAFWLDMMQDRNLTSHTYEHESAMEIYHNIKVYYPVMQKTYQELQQKFLVSEGI